MKLYYMHPLDTTKRNGALQVIETDLAKVFTDSKAGHLQKASVYQRVCGTISDSLNGGGDMGLDAEETQVYFRVSHSEAAKHLAPGTKTRKQFRPT